MAENIKRPEPPFWRAALGGVVGGLLWLVLIPAFRKNLNNPYYVLAFFYAFFYVTISSGFVGMLCGLTVWHFDNRTGRSLGVIQRLALGAALSVAVTALIVTALYLIMKSNNHEPTVWLSNKGYIALWGALVGACSGMVIRNRGAVENGDEPVSRRADG